ncbi:hypothetical protein MKW98_010371 [Papaver atlanticum]|uniref:Ycf54 n=1 Tax=Papaver atlanticum TaxID=357466 RepID=A0AAD4SM02_9MAGN|nr:hypothetical protein MKW98_010371 [Papaver atlanticum]
MLPSVALFLNSCSGFPAAPSHHQTEKVSGGLLLGSIKFPSNSSCSFNGLSANPLILSTTRKVTSLAVASNQLDPAVKVEGGKKKYYFLVANAKFMLDEEEHFQEQMVERLRLFKERNMEQDFWLAIEPKFLDKFPQITKRLGRPAVALVSTNGPWITFMKLRLDRVLSESYEADSLEEALASTPTNLEFKKPENWVAPYPKYESGWWEPFLLQ